MIKVVFFDFYNTLVRFWPPLDLIQQAACREVGFTIEPEALNYGYSVADIYFNRENEINPLGDRTEEERLQFFSKYEQIILESAGLSVSIDLAREIWQIAISVPKEFALFDETLPALTSLKDKGYRVGLISNLRRDMDQLCRDLGLSPYVDYCLTSAEVGVEKPNPAIFQAALERAGVSPSQAVHVGDQPRSDLVGARGAGMHAVLLDRGNWHSEVDNCIRIASLAELDDLLADAPRSLLVVKRSEAPTPAYPDEQAAE